MQPPFIWDHYSDQPHVITDKAYKKKMKKPHTFDYLKLFLISLVVLPIALLSMGFFRKKTKIAMGLCVNLDKGDAQPALIDELGIKNLLIRFALWEMDKLHEYKAFAKSFGEDKKIVIAILQDREHIENPIMLRDHLSQVFSTFGEFCDEFQIANAINRTKWGFFSVGEYLSFYRVAMQLRDEKFPHIKLLGPSVIDFEYYYTARALFSLQDVYFDKVSALLYVDRRGAPQNTQYALFDTANKINLLYALAKMSPKASDEIYITEVNWPLQNTAPYAPTSEKECVSEEAYAQYLKDYLTICKQSGKISKVFWHQLIAPGYGLVDNRGGILRKTKGYYVLKEMMDANFC